MAREPAALRYNNPGAQWDGPIAKRWGSTQHVVLADGQANHIAIFPTKVQGACAQMDLWKSRYTGLTLQAAVTKWCGGNFPAAYMAFLEQKTGVSRTEPVTVAFLASARGLSLMKAQAQWEAGKPYPMTEAEWQKAHAAVFKGGKLPDTPTSTKVVVSGGTAAGTAAAAQQAAAAGYNYGAVIGIVFVGIVIAAVIWIIMSRKDDSSVPRPLPIPDPTPQPVPGRGAIEPMGHVAGELR